MEKGELRDILQRYGQRIERQLGDESVPLTLMSKDYETFRRESLENSVSFYENACNVSERILHIKAGMKDREELEKHIRLAHLMITPDGAASFAGIVAMAIILLGVCIGAITYAFGELYIGTTLFFVVLGAVLIKPLVHIPRFIATRVRLEASNQMILCILYIVIYMRHTSNLEHAVKFAGEHVGPPLSLDLKKVLWDVETGEYITIRDSLEKYLEQWRETNLEFVEAFHLIEGSLYESTESRRIEILEKALQVMLEGTYDKMLHYAQNLQSPITILYMLGIILPILGLVLLPLIGSFLGGAVRWYHVGILYNILLPVIIYAMGNNILVKRPTGYGGVDIIKLNPELRQLGNVSSAVILSLFVGAVFCLIGIAPVLLHWFDPGFDAEILGYKILDYKGGNGPFGLWALLLSLFVPLGLAVALSMYYTAKTKNLIEYKKRTDVLEEEFSGAIFQLGNRIGDGIPTESAFRNVAENMRGTPSGEFFSTIDNNLRNLGMGLKKAIFDESRGGILRFPSKIVESSMRILVESARKGPMVVSKSLVTMSEYMTKVRQVNERLKDLLAEVLSSISSQISFLTPLIAGIVVGVSSMVVTVINLLSEQFAALGTSSEEAGLAGGLAPIASILRIEDVIPGFYFQLVVGLYVVEITVLLTLLSTQIERGVDTTTSYYRASKNLVRSVGLYTVVSLIGIILFNLLAKTIGVATAAPGVTS